MSGMDENLMPGDSAATVLSKSWAEVFPPHKVRHALERLLFRVEPFDLAASLILAGTYVRNTYVVEEKLTPLNWVLELVGAAVITLDFCARAKLADDSAAMLLSVRSAVILLVVIPIFPVSPFLASHTLWIGLGTAPAFFRIVFPVRFSAVLLLPTLLLLLTAPLVSHRCASSRSSSASTT